MTQEQKKMNKQRKDYEAPYLSTEEVRIEKAFLADAAASANLPEGAEDGGNIDDWFVVEP